MTNYAFQEISGSGNVAYDTSMKTYAPSRSYGGSTDFAPEVTERLITRTATISTEVKKGEFESTDAKVKEIVNVADAYLLNENIIVSGEGIKEYNTGHYEIKVDTEKYASVVSQLQSLGKVQSFNEDKDDITGSYQDLQVELNAEKERLQRFESMYSEAEDVSDKITLNDRIFDQERRVKYLEKAVENLDKKVSYSTIYLTLREKQSPYANVVFVKFSELVKRMVSSLNSLLSLVFVLLPWIIVAGAVFAIVKIGKKQKRKKR